MQRLCPFHCHTESSTSTLPLRNIRRRLSLPLVQLFSVFSSSPLLYSFCKRCFLFRFQLFTAILLLNFWKTSTKHRITLANYLCTNTLQSHTRTFSPISQLQLNRAKKWKFSTLKLNVYSLCWIVNEKQDPRISSILKDYCGSFIGHS